MPAPIPMGDFMKMQAKLADNSSATLFKRNTINLSDNQNQKSKNDSFSLNDYEFEKVIAIDDIQPQNNSPSNT